MSAEQRRLLQDLRDQYTDSQDWNLRYKAVFKDIHGPELGTLITTMKPLDLGTSISQDHMHSLLLLLCIMCGLMVVPCELHVIPVHTN